MSNRNNFIFSLDGEQKSFFISKIDVSQFCRLIRSAFNTDKTITALQDAQGNIQDVHYFCESISATRDRFFIILTERGRQQKRNREPSYQIQDIQNFIQELQYMKFNQQQYTLIIIFDNEQQAQIGNQLVYRIHKQFPFLQVYYTIIKEEETDSLLLALFENQNLKKELELRITQNIQEDICRSLHQMIEEDESDEIPQQVNSIPAVPQIPQIPQFSNIDNNIPLIVTRNDQKLVLQVEPNDNFHSSQGKRTNGVTRIKKAVEKLKDKLEEQEYQQILQMLVVQDQSIFQAYQLYLRSQNEDQFLQNLRVLISDETNNLSFNREQRKFITSPDRSQSQLSQYDNITPGLRSTDQIIDTILYSKQLELQENGVLREMRNDQEIQDLIKSMKDSTIETIVQVIKPFLSQRFKKQLQTKFNNNEIEYIFQEKNNKLSPIYAGLVIYSNQGDIDSLIRLIEENLKQDSRKFSFYILYSQQHHAVFSLQMNGPHVQEQVKSNIDIYELQQFKEQFIDRFHTKKLQKYSNSDYDKMFKSVLEKCVYLDEVEKNKMIDFYNQGNQRVQEILDKYGKNYDINNIKNDINDLLIMQSKRTDHIQSPTNSAVIDTKMQKLKNFKFLITYYYEDKTFSIRQMKGFLYLYTIEDMSILAAYEVYCENKDQDEFIETLHQIYKIYSLDNIIDFDEIEQFDELIEQQLNIIFAYRRFLSLDQRTSLEKNLRTGDTTLLNIFRDFVRSKLQKKFIEELCQFADQKFVELRKIEQDIKNLKANRDERKNEYKNTIIQYNSSLMKNYIKYMDVMIEAVDKDNIIIKSIFEVFNTTLDKQEFIENLQIAYQLLYRQNLRSILKALTIELQKPKTQLTYLLKKLDSEDPIMKGAFELYFLNKDQNELKDTIDRILKFM
ncbi:hypothetical protein pb186bvf_018456 [Paramecium bursaria]